MIYRLDDTFTLHSSDILRERHHLQIIMTCVYVYRLCSLKIDHLILISAIFAISDAVMIGFCTHYHLFTILSTTKRVCLSA